MARAKKRPYNRKVPLEDFVGKQFKTFKVVSFVSITNGDRLWLCHCICGNEIILPTRKLNPNTKPYSCGCLNRELQRQRRLLPEGEAGRREVLRYYKGSAKKRGLEFTISDSDFYNLTIQNCFYCNARPSNRIATQDTKGFYLYNGVDRRDNNLGYIPGNCLSCCKRCNMAKGSLTWKEFLNMCTTIADRHRIG